MIIKLEITGDTQERDMQNVLKALGNLDFHHQVLAPVKVDAGPVEAYNVDAAHEATSNVRQFGEDVKQAIQQEADEANAKREAAANVAKTEKKREKKEKAPTTDSVPDASPDAGSDNTGDIVPPAPVETVKQYTTADLSEKAKELIVKGDTFRQRTTEAVRTFKGGAYRRASDVHDQDDINALMAILEAIK